MARIASVRQLVSSFGESDWSVSRNLRLDLLNEPRYRISALRVRRHGARPLRRIMRTTYSNLVVMTRVAWSPLIQGVLVELVDMTMDAPLLF